MLVGYLRHGRQFFHYGGHPLVAVASLSLLCLTQAPVSSAQGLDTLFSADQSGKLTFTFDYDQNERENDFDFSIGARTEMDTTLYGRQISLVFNGRSRFDMDHGSSDRDRAFEARTDQRVFQAFIDTPTFGESGIRLGRQWIHEIENVHLDGLRFSMKNNKSDLIVFGGRPVSEFSSISSDYVYGGQFRLLPSDSEWRLYFLLNDEAPYVNDQTGIGFSHSLWQRRARVYGDFTLLNGRGRELQLGTLAFIPAIKTDLSARYYQRLQKSRATIDLADDRIFSEYFRILGAAQRLHQFDLTVTKYFNTFAVAGGWNVTAVDNDDSGSRNAMHAYFNLHIFDFIKKDLALLLQANVVRQKFDSQYSYDIAGSSGTVGAESRDVNFGGSGQIDYRMNRDTRFSIGTSYSNYDFSSQADPHVIFTEAASSPIGVLTNVPELLSQDLGGNFIIRTWFFEFRKRLTSKWEIRLRTSYDRSTLSRNIGSRGYKQAFLRLTRRF